MANDFVWGEQTATDSGWAESQRCAAAVSQHLLNTEPFRRGYDKNYDNELARAAGRAVGADAAITAV